MKPDFKEIYFDPSVICWGRGNDIVGPNCIATIRLRDYTKKENAELKKQYDAAKLIYDKNINLGSKFKPIGAKHNTKIECKITFINSKKQSVTWKQYNLSKEQTEMNYKPAAGKWSINAMIKLVKNKEIEFIN